MKKIAKYASFLGIAGLLLALATGCDSYKEDEDFGEAALVAEQNEAVRAVTESDTWKSAEFFVVAKCGAGGFKFPVMYTADDITAVSLKVISSKKINVLQPFLNDGWKQGTDAIDTEAGKWVTVTSSDSAAHKGAGVQVLDTAAEGIYVFGIKDFKVTTSSGTKTITASDLKEDCDLSWGGKNIYAKIQENKNKVVDENEKALSDLQDEVEKLKGELEKVLGAEAKKKLIEEAKNSIDSSAKIKLVEYYDAGTSNVKPVLTLDEKGKAGKTFSFKVKSTVTGWKTSIYSKDPWNDTYENASYVWLDANTEKEISVTLSDYDTCFGFYFYYDASEKTDNGAAGFAIYDVKVDGTEISDYSKIRFENWGSGSTEVKEVVPAN